MGKAKVKHNRTNNINMILEKLLITSPGAGASLQELSDLCNVSNRNTYRYLKDIEKMGFDLIRPGHSTPRDSTGHYRLNPVTNRPCQTDIDLMMLLGVHNQRQAEYYKSFCVMYELLVRRIAIKNGIFIPLKWSLTIF